MNRKLLIYLALIFLGVMYGSAAQAQMAQNRYQSEVARTDEVIGWANEIVNEARVRIDDRNHGEPIQIALTKAEALLDAARNIQEEARRFGQRGMYLEGIRTTVEARERAWQAVSAVRQAGERFARPGEENENIVLRQLEKTDELENRVKEVASSASSAPLASLFDSARDIQRRAWEFYRNQNYRPALRLSLQSERTLRSILERVEEQGGGRSRLENQLRQTEQRLIRLEGIIAQCQNQEMTDQYRKAQEELREAQRYLASGEPGKAAGLVNSIQQVIRRISQACGDSENLRQKLHQLQAEADRIAERIGGSGPAARRHYETALNLLAEAERLCNSGDVEACAANLRAAQLSLEKARREAGI